MTASLAASITKAASKQSYYTIRFLVDRALVEDAYRTYAYFRWVDDVLDAASDSGAVPGEAETAGRKVFLQRQMSLLESCYRNEAPRELTVEEQMLADLVERDRDAHSGLGVYLHTMMVVMDFDLRRRGALISQAELDEYTRLLAVAVTEAIHYFIGHGEFAPRDETRYQAVTAAHIAHMLRDTYDDLEDGYFNVPREVLEANRIRPQDVQNAAYRAWVRDRVQLARELFKAGGVYFQRAQNLRHRLAGFAYTARFELLLDTIEKEGFRLRPHYKERKSLGYGLRMFWLTISSLLGFRFRA
ncbi:MAG: squalene/phytoene synthase family protein [Anaerolineales bacterium]|nr:squalene/phytoene synthase family protein [Anaerolineales bacterium]